MTDVESLSTPKRPLWKRILRWLAIPFVLLLLIGGFALLNKDRIKMMGTGPSTIYFEWESKDEQYARIEAEREAQKAAAAPAVSATEMAALDALPKWPGYRGARRDGKSDETGLLQSWPEGGPPVIWRKPVGLGWGSFAIGLGRAYTIEQRRENEVLACYDFETGAELWNHAWKASFVEQAGGEGPRSTPTLDGDRVYVLGAEGDFSCLNALSGEKIWGVNILKDFGDENLHWGMSASPLVVGEKVLVTAGGGPNRPGLHAYDKMTGKLIYSAVKQRHSYASLMLVNLAGREQLLDFSGDFINGVDPATGEILWTHDWEMMNDVNAGQPIVTGAERVFISSGYGKGATLLEVKSAPDGKLAVSDLWKNLNMKNKFASSILHEGHIYGLDEGILACVDVEKGKRIWKGGRYHHGQMIYADGSLIVVTEEGALALVKAAPDAFTEFSTCEALDGKTWNNPALAGGRLLVRNDKEMICFDLRVK